MKIKMIQVITDLSQLAGDIEAGLYDTAGMIKAVDSVKAKMLELEAFEDAISDIENNEVEVRAERQAGEVEQRRDAYREEEMSDSTLTLEEKEEELTN